MKGKKILKIALFIGSFVWSFNGFSQLSLGNVDQRVIDLYGESRVVQMINDQPQFISYLNYYVKNAYQIVTDVPERKLSQFEDISTIKNTRTGENLSAEDINDLNILLLSITRNQDQFLSYKVGDTGTVIVFIAPSQVMSEFLLTQENK